METSNSNQGTSGETVAFATLFFAVLLDIIFVHNFVKKQATAMILLLLVIVTPIFFWIAANALRRLVNVNYSNKQAPPLVNDNSLLFTIPWLGGDLFAMKNQGLKNYLLAKQQQHGDLFTLYVAGKYVTFSFNAAHQNAMHKAKTNELDLNHALANLFSVVLPQELRKSTLDPHSMTVYKVLTGVTLSDARMQQLVQEMPKTLHLLYDRFGWKRNGMVQDFFKQTYELVFHLNVHTFMGAECGNNIKLVKDLFESFSLAFEGSDKKKALMQSLRNYFLPCAKQQRDVDVNFDKFVQLCRPAIEKRMDDGNNTEHADLLQDYLLYYMKESNDREYVMKQTAMLLFGIILGAQSNTYSTLAWTICHLASHAHVKNEIFPCTYDDEAKMNRLEDCIRESIRLAKADWIMMRQVMSPFTCGDMVIPKDNFLFMKNVIADEAIVGSNPEQFDPYRYERHPELFKAAQKHPQLWGSSLHLCM